MLLHYIELISEYQDTRRSEDVGAPSSDTDTPQQDTPDCPSTGTPAWPSRQPLIPSSTRPFGLVRIETRLPQRSNRSGVM